MLPTLFFNQQECGRHGEHDKGYSKKCVCMEKHVTQDHTLMLKWITYSQCYHNIANLLLQANAFTILASEKEMNFSLAR